MIYLGTKTSYSHALFGGYQVTGSDEMLKIYSGYSSGSGPQKLGYSMHENIFFKSVKVELFQSIGKYLSLLKHFLCSLGFCCHVRSVFY